MSTRGEEEEEATPLGDTGQSRSSRIDVIAPVGEIARCVYQEKYMG